MEVQQMSSLMRSFLVTAAAAGAGYLWRNRGSLRGLRGMRGTSSPTGDRGVTIYHNHPAAE
jgi:hypothetical protein